MQGCGAESLPRGKSVKPTGVGCELWHLILSTVDGREWFQCTSDYIFFGEIMPAPGNLICVIPGFKNEFIPPSAGGIGWLRPLLFSKEKRPMLSQAGVPPLQTVTWVVKGSEPDFLVRTRCRLPRWWNCRYTVPGVRRFEIKSNFEFWNCH